MKVESFSLSGTDKCSGKKYVFNFWAVFVLWRTMQICKMLFQYDGGIRLCMKNSQQNVAWVGHS